VKRDCKPLQRDAVQIGYIAGTKTGVAT